MKLEGSPAEVAEQLFTMIIGPMFDHLVKENPALAVEFGYCVAGNAIACCLNSISEVNHGEKLIIESTKSMVADIKRHRNKIC
ncbi:hypothetical protein RFH42_16265 [Acinetobacter rudis]|uniref:hypothetical protein n=1 Tax=Acinetobacter rudis TaxID=632955 RepID=UPI00280F0632|nr:hypothetical protein [Acinetobacter rudis]MDQ8954505.1 hypothetical protein [Acinetobacter rudis]